jgi:hypothetical protein
VGWGHTPKRKKRTHLAPKVLFAAVGGYKSTLIFNGLLSIKPFIKNMTTTFLYTLTLALILCIKKITENFPVKKNEKSFYL